MPEKCYKVLKNGKSCHGGQQDWPLPTPAGPGEWLEHVGRLLPCHSGYHLTRLPAVWYTASGLDVYEAEYAGEHDACDDDKIVCRKVRLIKKLTEEELVAVRVYLSGSHAAKEGKVAASGSATVRASGSATVQAYGSATVEASGSATVAASDSATVEASGSATVNSYSKLNRIGLHSLAVEIDRSQPRVVVRHAANAAVMLEAANTQQGDAITKSEGAQMLTFGRQKQALANSLPVLEALADANVVTKGLDTSSRVKWSQEAERLVKLILASMEEEALLETNGVSTLEEAECASCGHEIKKGDGHYYVPGKGIEPTCCLGCWQEVVKQQTA